MTTLRTVRVVANLLMWAAIATGVVALFSGEWVLVAVAVVAFFVVGVVFANTNKGIDQITRDNAVKDADRIGLMVDSGDWHGALRVSNRAVQNLSQTVRVGGKQSENRGPLAAVLLVQSSLLGVTGDPVGSSLASRRAVALLEGVASPTPIAEELLQLGRQLQARATDPAFCARTAMELTS